MITYGSEPPPRFVSTITLPLRLRHFDWNQCAEVVGGVQDAVRGRWKSSEDQRLECGLTSAGVWHLDQRTSPSLERSAVNVNVPTAVCHRFSDLHILWRPKMELLQLFLAYPRFPCPASRNFEGDWRSSTQRGRSTLALVPKSTPLLSSLSVEEVIRIVW